MVAISLYRGNLHRVPDGPRRWLMPAPKISLKDFKTLLSRRNRALFRLRGSTATASATAITLNPNSISNSNSKEVPRSPPQKQQSTEAPTTSEPLSLLRDPSEPKKTGDFREEKEGNTNEGDREKLQGGSCSVEPVGEAEAAPEKAVDTGDGDRKLQSSEVEEKPTVPVNVIVQMSENVDALNEKEKRKLEVEEKLKTLNAKKHNLVQALKQILNAEVELKRRNCVQGTATRSSGSLQGDAANESGLMTRQATPRRVVSEGNVGNDAEGAEAEDASNHNNTHSRHVLRMSSMSPSSESPLRKPAYFQHNVVPHPPRASLGTTSSPSRFAPAGQQGQPGHLPTISVSGTNYVVSSPSPAASGGTSVFRDARQASPWN